MEKPHKTAAELFAAQALATQLKAELSKNILHTGWEEFPILTAGCTAV